MQEPTPPESLPKYIAEGLPKQSRETLVDTLAYVEDLIEWYDRPVEIDASHLDSGEELVEAKQSGKGTQVVKKVPCGKECNGCPHGPYEYRVYRDGGSLVWDYIGSYDG